MAHLYLILCDSWSVRRKVNLQRVLVSFAFKCFQHIFSLHIDCWCCGLQTKSQHIVVFANSLALIYKEGTQTGEWVGF